MDQRNAREEERRAPIREEVRNMTRSLFEAEAASAQALAMAGDAYDNEAFLEHYSGLAPLDHNWNDPFDSDETQPPSPRRHRLRRLLLLLHKMQVCPKHLIVF